MSRGCVRLLGIGFIPWGAFWVWLLAVKLQILDIDKYSMTIFWIAAGSYLIIMYFLGRYIQKQNRP